MKKKIRTLEPTCSFEGATQSIMLRCILNFSFRHIYNTMFCIFVTKGMEGYVYKRRSGFHAAHHCMLNEEFGDSDIWVISILFFPTTKLDKEWILFMSVVGVIINKHTSAQ